MCTLQSTHARKWVEWNHASVVYAVKHHCMSLAEVLSVMYTLKALAKYFHTHREEGYSYQVDKNIHVIKKWFTKYTCTTSNTKLHTKMGVHALVLIMILCDLYIILFEFIYYNSWASWPILIWVEILILKKVIIISMCTHTHIHTHSLMRAEFCASCPVDI